MARKTKRTARDVLYELKWRKGMSLSRAEIWYADRARAEEYKIIKGDEIAELGRGYFASGDSLLPYYKILRIIYGGEIVFERKENEQKTTK